MLPTFPLGSWAGVSVPGPLPRSAEGSTAHVRSGPAVTGVADVTLVTAVATATRRSSPTSRRAKTGRAKTRRATTAGAKTGRAKTGRAKTGGTTTGRAQGRAAPAPKAAPRTRSTARASTARTAATASGPRLGARLGAVLGQQSDDLKGLLCVVLAILVGLGTYTDLAGPAGRWFETGAADALGRGRWLVTPALALLGLMLIRSAHSPDRRQRPRPALGVEAPEPTHESSRIAIGCVLLLVAVCGILDITQTQRRLDGHLTLKVMRQAGGLLGAGVGRPLRDGLGGWGAGLVLAAILIVALLVITATSVRTALRGVGGGFLVVGRAFASVLRGLADGWHEDDRGASAERHPTGSQAGRQRQAERERRAGAAFYDQALDPATGEGDRDDEGSSRPRGDPSSDPRGPSRRASRPPVPISLPPQPSDTPPEQLTIGLGPAAAPGTWHLPPVHLLSRSKSVEVDRRMVEALGRTLEDALAAHGVETRLAGMTVGPTVTRYELELGPGVKVAKVTNLQRDIAYAMAAIDVRILAPIPGRSAIGVEVPNTQRQQVNLGDILTSQEAHDATHALEVGIGRDIAGRAVMANLATMPHILIAGATGAGKSSCINSIITSLLVRTTPDQVRMILVDPKQVELSQYNSVPHLLTQVVTNPKKAANALAWAVHEMERRYDLLAEVGFRDITGYNAAYDRGDLSGEPELGAPAPNYERLPFILIVIDELNDLMMVAARDVEESIVRIAQKARAVGIHLVIATQRPSVDVITGVIKANVPSRLAFAVSSLADSRVILDQPGAERLIGKGDMLLLSASSNVARRIQGAWVDEDEARKVVAHWRRQSAPRYVDGVEGTDDGPAGGALNLGSSGDADDDELLRQAMDLIVRSQLGSTSMLQRKLRVGFARAGRLMDLLEQRGVVGPSEGSKAREVLMSVQELEGGAAGESEASPG
jgi:S-DNA-T family DNA segregation ATPase FtsK/SpoIIIE